MTRTITTAAELAALTPDECVRDRMGDVGVVRDGHIYYPETAPQTLERAARKYGPFLVLPLHAVQSVADALPQVTFEDTPDGIAARASVVDDAVGRLTRSLAAAEDDAIRRQLVALGWTPPGTAALHALAPSVVPEAAAEDRTALLARMDPDTWFTEDGDWLIDPKSDEFVRDARALHALAAAQPVVPEAAVTLRAVIDEALADALGDTFSPSVMDDLARRVHDRVTAALPLLTAAPSATDWQELAREHQAVLCGDADATERLRRRVEGYFADEAAQPAPSATRDDEREMVQVIDERDAAENMADRLAARLAEALGRPDSLGEHSSSNDPWQNALDLPDPTITPSATRDEVARLIDPSGWRYFDTGLLPPDHPASTGVVHKSRETADALLARFNITPKEDR